MKAQSKKHRQGNWITFLSGALFNVLANVALNDAIHYSLHALVGGIVFLFFKMLSDGITPHITNWCRSVWKKAYYYLKSLIFGSGGESHTSKYHERGKTPRA